MTAEVPAEPAGAIRVFISGNSGNKEIVTHQHRILMILDGLSINIEEVDISAPGMEEARDFMRANGKKKEGERHVLPPQIFNGDKYCGDYEDFDVANEDDELEEFLGIPRKTPKFDPNAGTNTGEDVGKLEQPTVNGTSDKSEISKEEVQQATNPSEDTEAKIDTTETDHANDEATAEQNGDEQIESEQTQSTSEENDQTEDDLEARA